MPANSSPCRKRSLASDLTTGSDSHKLNEPYSLSSVDIIKWILIKPCCCLAIANALSANASTSERLLGSVLNFRRRAYIIVSPLVYVIVIGFDRLVIHSIFKHITKLE